MRTTPRKVLQEAKKFHAQRQYAQRLREQIEDAALIILIGATTPVRRLHEALTERSVVKQHANMSSAGLADPKMAKTLARLVDGEVATMESLGFTNYDYFLIVGYCMGTSPEPLTSLQLSFAETKIGELAAAKQLGKDGWLSLEMVARYAPYGYHLHMGKLDPILANIKRSYQGGALSLDDIDWPVLTTLLDCADTESLRKILPYVWEYAEPDGEFAAQHPEVSTFWRELIRQIPQKTINELLDHDPKHTATANARAAIRHLLDLPTDVK